uniref:Uncharacterized protein n=1 Tax=Tetranychus urticae TaxID=32264 RepID=T1KE79_TETUR
MIFERLRNFNNTVNGKQQRFKLRVVLIEDIQAMITRNKLTWLRRFRSVGSKW